MEGSQNILVIGAGLAGAEAAWQVARAGVRAALYEMRPVRPTPAHKTDRLAELVCSNSLKSNRPESAAGLLKQELRRTGSLLLRVADASAVPGGTALTVDREQFAAGVTDAIARNPLITVRREEVRAVPRHSLVILATGPLTSDALSRDLNRLTGSDHLYFYDAISPIVDAETVDCTKVFRASRYGKDSHPSSEGDYLNCPLTREEYDRFLQALLAAEEVKRHEFEDVRYFEACLPLEELARRGRDTLRFGPMKPVGLRDPRTGRRPYAVVQLRQEDARASSYNLVGFQNHLKFGEQKRILRMIPGLENAEFLRYGQIHRNTYVNAPALLAPTLQLRSHPRLFLAGQLCGTEGYVEAIATGLLAGRHAACLARGEVLVPPPRETALGSLIHYITRASPGGYQPANIAFDLLPPLPADLPTEAVAQVGALAEPGLHNKKQRRARQCQRALAALEEWCRESRSVPVVAE
ncbi:MAG: methylenetetrahydrofolate--tRNA-(uracil(54)-C(5))-methyltransferase (FADH(2)-oxidizing) TrmFO [Terriglobia bacterium]